MNDILNNANNISDIRHKMDHNGIKTVRQAFMCYNTLGENTNCDLVGRPGLYPLYSYDAQLANGSIYFVPWGCLIVIPYTYKENDDSDSDWRLQIIICGNGWDYGSGISVLTRRCNYYGGWAKWNKTH